MIYLNKIPRYGLNIQDILNVLIEKHLDVKQEDGVKIYTSELINGTIAIIKEMPVHGKRCGEKNFTIEPDTKTTRYLIRTIVNLMLKS